MSGNIKGIIVEIGGDTSGLQKALKKVNSSTSSLSKELKGINSLLKLDPKNTELVSQKQIVLKKNIEETESKIRALKEAQDRYIESGGDLNSSEYRNLQREIINTENKLKQMKLEASKWTQAGRSIEEFGNKITNISNKIDKVGTTLTTRLTLPILGIATAAVNSAREFESAFTGVEKTVDGTATQMANLKQGIKDMSEEIPASTTEIAGVAEAAGQLGIQTDNVLAFTKTMINMGNATNLSADEAATTLARFANVTKMSQSDFDRLGSVIVALGNNFATTEAEISAMGMNLASAGTQVGMSQSQIMALATALSSVGLEAQAGGTAFSKVMVNMQLAVEKGGKELKNFASVAGMSIQQFKKAFKEDATNAIMQFVDGLSKSGERGQSAIKILDDMGITETRLRDALLRSANASEVMGKAIELGNQAWEENTALTNEANKRYQTLDSRMEMTKNKIKNVATNTGDKLTPSFNKLLDKVDGLIDKFDGLNEEETENIIKTAAIVAAVGPAIKILSTIGTTTGKTITNIGKLSKAIGEVKSGSEATTISMKALKLMVTALSNPVGQVTLAMTALCAAYLAYRAIAEAETRKIINEVNEQNKAWQKLQETRDDTLSSSMTEISYYEKLANELKKITDENGKVKEGYENRAKYILGELNKALGTEYSMNGNIISQYEDLKNNIDQLILSKKAEATLDAYKSEYQQAIKNEQESTKTLTELRQKYNEELSKSTKNAKEEVEKQRNITRIGKAIKKQTELIGEYGYTIQNYEKLTSASISGNADEINKAIESMGTSYNDFKNKGNSSLSEQISSQSNYVNLLKESWKDAANTNDRYQAQILQTQIETQDKKLSNLAESLASQTYTVGSLSQEQINAWSELAGKSITAYNEGLSSLDSDTRKKVEQATGILVEEKALPNGAKDLSYRAAEGFKLNFNTDGSVSAEIDRTQTTLKMDKKIEVGARLLASKANTGFNDNVDGNKWGTDLSSNISSGLTSQKSQSWITSAASKVAGWISEYLHHTTPDKGPLKDDDKWMIDFIDNMASGILDNKSKVTSAVKQLSQEMTKSMNMPLIQDFGKLQGSLSNQIIDSTKTIFTTPQIIFNVQELDKARLQQCFEYVNRKFGSQY